MKWINATAKLLEFRNEKERINTTNTEKQTINILEMDENEDRMLYNGMFTFLLDNSCPKFAETK